MDTLTSCLIRSNVFLCSGAQDPAAFTVWLSRPKGCRTPCTACLRSRRSSSGKWICESTDGVFWDSIYVILTSQMNCIYPSALPNCFIKFMVSKAIHQPSMRSRARADVWSRDTGFFELRPTKWRGQRVFTCWQPLVGAPRTEGRLALSRFL